MVPRISILREQKPHNFVVNFDAAPMDMRQAKYGFAVTVSFRILRAADLRSP